MNNDYPPFGQVTIKTGLSFTCFNGRHVDYIITWTSDNSQVLNTVYKVFETVC